MTRAFGRSTIEDLYMEIDRLEKRLGSLENRKDLILPYRSSARLPLGQEGQLVIADTDTAFPISTSPKTVWVFINGSWQQIGTSFIIPRNLGEIGLIANTSNTSSNTAVLNPEKDSVLPGNGILVLATAPSVPITSATPGYPTTCVDSIGNTYTKIHQSKFEAATPAVNDGVAPALFFCTSSVAVLPKTTGSITVTWSNPVFDKQIWAWRVLHDGGAATPLLSVASTDSNTSDKASTGFLLSIPSWTPTRVNSFLLALLFFSSASAGTGGFGSFGGYTGFFQTTGHSWNSSRVNNSVFQQTHGADVYVQVGSNIVTTEIDLGTLTPVLQAGFNGLGQTYTNGAGNWKGGIVLKIG